MLRRRFLKLVSAFFFFPSFNIKSQIYTFGGWFFMTDIMCYEFWYSYGSEQEKDAFLSGHNRFKGRGWYCFSWEGILDTASIFRLFNECKHNWFPIIEK